jgi:hypothetical protein
MSSSTSQSLLADIFINIIYIVSINQSAGTVTYQTPLGCRPRIKALMMAADSNRLLL